MNPRVKKVVPESDYRLRLTFTDDDVRVYDMRPLLGKGVFRELQDESMFRSVHCWHGTVQWSGGQDICPDTLYEDSVPAAEAASASVREPKTEYRVKPAGPKARRNPSS